MQGLTVIEFDPEPIRLRRDMGHATPLEIRDRILWYQRP